MRCQPRQFLRIGDLEQSVRVAVRLAVDDPAVAQEKRRGFFEGVPGTAGDQLRR